MPKEGKHGGDRSTFGAGNLDIETTCIDDGVEQAVSANAVTNGKRTTLTWAFPSFTNSLDYDPSLNMDDADDGSASTAASYLLLMLALMIVSVKMFEIKNTSRNSIAS